MLRRLLTAFVVLGIAAIAGLAIADAFRSHEEPEGEPAKPAPARHELRTATEGPLCRHRPVIRAAKSARVASAAPGLGWEPLV